MTKIKVAIAVFDTSQNDRTKYTIKTYESLLKTINHKTTEVYFIDNDSCAKTKTFLKSIKKSNFHIITNKENQGTAEAINKVIKLRESGDYIVKCDNDVWFYDYGWAEKMVKCFQKDPELGVLGLKRKDLPNEPNSKEYPTELKFIQTEVNDIHKKGDTWDIIEVCDDIIGTCTMFNPELLDEVGYLYQPSVYGFDDVLMCSRSIIAGFYNAFYSSIEIEHMDDGKNPFTEWKKKHAGIYLSRISGIIKSYEEGNNPMMEHENSVYYNPF